MYTGSGFMNDTCGDGSNPAYTAYRDWLTKTVGVGDKRPSWDLLTVYAAIVGTDAAMMYEEQGTNDVTEKGGETWDVLHKDSNEVRLQFQNDDSKAKVTEILEQILCEGNGNEATFL